MAEFKGRIRDEDGNWQLDHGSAEIRHRGPWSEVDVGGLGSGKISWNGTRGSGTYRFPDGTTGRLEVVAVEPGRYKYTITRTDGWYGEQAKSEGEIVE